MRNKALFQLGKLLDQKGEELLPKYVYRGSLITPEQVFERLIVGLLDGMVRVDRLDRIGGRITQEEALARLETSEQALKEWVIQTLRESKLGGLFSWDMIAEGVLAISRLAQKFNLSRLYPDLLERCESDRKVARHELLSLLLSIQGISNKKALVLLRDLHFQCVWDYPLEDLPMPVDTHVPVVMKRMGFIQGGRCLL